MKRRDFLGALGSAAAAWPVAVRAQQADKVAKLGFLSPSSPGDPRDKEFRQALRDLGYVEGKNIIIEGRFAAGNFDQLPALAAELVALKVDVIVASVTQASLAARGATKTIPIVMQGVSDPAGIGLVVSLAQPGGNVTGTSGMSAEVVGKSLELLKELLPKISKVAVLWNPENAVFHMQMLRESQAAAKVLGVDLQLFGARAASEFDQVFDAIAIGRPEGLLVLADPIFALHRARIIAFAEKIGLPAVYGNRDHPVSGGLMSYGPDYDELYRRAAVYVDKILKGAKPADLPVEQATKFPLALNLKAAKAIGVTMPPSLLARADEVIE